MFVFVNSCLHVFFLYLKVFVYSFILFGNEDKRVGTAESDLEQRPLGADLLVIS